MKQQRKNMKNCKLKCKTLNLRMKHLSVFGKEHAGYVCYMGLGITPSQVSTHCTRLASCSIEANEKMLKMQVEIDLLKDKASQVDILQVQVAFLMQMQNSREKEPTN